MFAVFTIFAVLKTGGKQYRVNEGAVIEVELLKGEVGEEVKFSEVLLVGSEENLKVGKPLVAGASVTAKVIERKRAKKLITFKKIKRHGKRLKKGHRQDLVRVKVEQIVGA